MIRAFRAPASTPMYIEVSHPCIQHKLGILRDRDTGHKKFRELATEITMFVCYEALKNVQLETITVNTPLCATQSQRIATDLVVVPILRAGVGMLDGILGLVPTARVGFVGLFRDETTKEPVAYYDKIPSGQKESLHILVDPMLATGGSTVAAINLLKTQGVKNSIVVCIVTCPEGLARVEKAHPDVPIYAASVDSHLDEHKYIVPGLGDAGDRLFGTR